MPRNATEGPRRRAVLGAAAAAAIGAAAGCTTDGSSRPRPSRGSPRPSRSGTRPGAAAERDLPGDRDFWLRSAGPPDAIEGYADRVSVRPGEAFTLHVSTTGASFRVSAYRVGWYRGAQARLVWRSGEIRGRRQPGPSFASATRTVFTRWEPALTVATGGWPAGAYLIRLDGSHGHQRYVPLVVASASGAGKTVIVHAPETWQAYNLWGGYSLYQGEDGSYGTRSLQVSFSRPYEGDGASRFMIYERAFAVLAERTGIPLAYTTGPDIERDPAVLRGATAICTLGHDEYWTPGRRAAVTRARDAGTNLAFLGANTCFRRIRLASGAAVGPSVICYKSDVGQDPMYSSHPALAATDYRAAPAPDPESRLTGVIYEGYPVDAPYVIWQPDHWLYAGTGARRGQSFAHLVGVEYDGVDLGYPTPRPIEVLAHSPVVCEGRPGYSDTAYYTTSSGAGVFASGTMRWVESMMAGRGGDGTDHHIPAAAGRFVTRVNTNLLLGFASGPAREHYPPAQDNVTALG
ncbi:MAG TPA: N,N-dimethylformamidase beta subunit family domain-containing protein [Streptosporangiaceae bacterium]|nr:N,N-dimethylformamidase beta subunit family domain-containing protein [Streptosporangiaceae bacterium]